MNQGTISLSSNHHSTSNNAVSQSLAVKPAALAEHLSSISHTVFHPDRLKSYQKIDHAHTDDMRQSTSWVISGRGGFGMSNPRDRVAVSLQLLTIEGNTIIASREASPGLTEMEFDVRGALLSRFGFDQGGVMVINSRTQTLVETLRIARDRFLEKSSHQGLSRNELAILIPDWDSSVWRTVAATLGLSEESVISVETDLTGKMSGDSMIHAIEVAQESGKTPFFWSAHYGAHSVGAGARDPIDSIISRLDESGALPEGVWAHLEGGHGSEALVVEGSEQERHLKHFDSVHIDVKKMGLSLPGRGQVVLFQDQKDTKRHVKTEASKYLYHDPNERADSLESESESFDLSSDDSAVGSSKKSIGPDSPLCTQSSALAGLWWYLRTHSDEDLSATLHQKEDFAHTFINLCEAESFDHPIHFCDRDNRNSIVAISIPTLSSEQLDQLVAQAADQYGIEFKQYQFKGESRLSIRFVSPDMDAGKINYLVSALKRLLSHDNPETAQVIPSMPRVNALQMKPGYAPLKLDSDKAFEATYLGNIKELSEDEIDQFFDKEGICCANVEGDEVRQTGRIGERARDVLLQKFMQVIHSGPKMSTRNHNQVGGFVAYGAAQHSMEALLNRPTEEELAEANNFLTQFLAYYIEDRDMSYVAHQEMPLSHTITVDSGTIANKEALAGAMQHLAHVHEQAGRSFDMNSIAVLVPETAHYSFEKAVEALGMPADNLIRIDVGPDQRVDMSALHRSMEQAKQAGLTPGFLAGIFGTTTVGVVDRVDELNQYVKEYNEKNVTNPIWLHIDAAQGFIHYNSERGYHLRSFPDSITMDWHKAGLGFNTLASLLVFGDKDIHLASSGHHHPEQVGIANYLSEISEDGSVGGAVAAVKANALQARSCVDDFVTRVTNDPDCPFDIVIADRNSMVAFTLKDQFTQGKSSEEIEQLINDWRSEASTGEGEEQWAFNLVHLMKRAPQVSDQTDRSERNLSTELPNSKEVPCLRVNFINQLHDESTVTAAINQLKRSAERTLFAKTSG